MSAPATTSRRKWPWILGLLPVLLVIGYFVITSTAFVRAVVLPRVAATLHCDLAVGDIALSPFSSLTLRQVKVTPRGAETLATIEELRLRYSLLAILRGTMTVSEILVDTPVITVVGRKDGSSNLAQWLDSLAAEKNSATGSPPKSASDKPAQLDVHNVALKNGTLRQTTAGPAGTSQVEVTGLNLTLDQLVNGSPSKLTLGALAAVTANATNSLAAKADAGFTLDLDPALQPTRVNGTLDVGVTRASGQFRNLDQGALKLSADTTVSEIKSLSVALTQSGRPMGELSVRGPFDPAKKEAHLTYELKGIDRNALGIVGAMTGVDFGQTTIAAAGQLDVTQQGQAFALKGNLAAKQLSLKSTAGASPVLDSTLDYQLQVELTKKSALIEKFNLAVQQGAAPIIKGNLDSPMSLAWDQAAPGFKTATYRLSVKQFDLAPWRPLAGTNLPAGRLNLEASVTSEGDGRRLKFAVDGGLEHIEAAVSGKWIRELAVTLKAAGAIEDLKNFTLDQASGEARYAGQPLAEYNANGNFNQGTGQVSGKTRFTLQLPAALKMYPVEGVALTAGQAQLTAELGSKSGQTIVTNGFGLVGLTGNLHGATLRDYQVMWSGVATQNGQRVVLQQGALTLRSGSEPGGSLEMTGEFDQGTQQGRFDFKTVNLNEKAIGPFLAAALAPNELRSVSLDLTGQAQLDMKAGSSLKSALKVSRLVTRNPARTGPEQPLEFSLTLDAAQREQTLDLRSLVVDLGATPKAANRVQATGKFDFATNRPAPSSLTVTSDGLDLTKLYDLATAGNDASKPAPESPSTTKKPGEPIQLPLEQFTLDANFARIFLREIAISNLVTKVVTHGGKIVVNPFSLTLNGAPVSATADLDVGVPGYRYDLTSDLKAVPVPPLAKSLLTGQLVDLKGTINGKMKLTGAGVEGAELRQHLAGNVEFAATNLDYQITALQTPMMKSLVLTLSTALQVPDISQSPLQFIGAQFEAGQGNVNLKNARVSSAAFSAGAEGKIQLADILTNSPIAIPVTVSLPKDGKLEALPQFLTMRGTLGAPKPDINALGLAQAATHLPGAAGDLVNKGVGQLGGALDRALGSKGSTNPGAGTSLIQGLLGGGTRTNTTPGATNAAGATNAPAKPFNPFDLLKKPAK